MITVRKAEVADTKQLVALMDELIHETNNPEAVANEIEEIRRDERYYLAVACDGEVIAGTVMGILCRDICKGGRPFLVIENVITHEAYRGNGVGRLLFEEVERWGKENRCAYSFLASGCGRTGAHVFYERIGYSRVCGFRKYFD